MTKINLAELEQNNALPDFILTLIETGLFGAIFGSFLKKVWSEYLIGKDGKYFFTIALIANAIRLGFAVKELYSAANPNVNKWGKFGWSTLMTAKILTAITGSLLAIPAFGILTPALFVASMAADTLRNIGLGIWHTFKYNQLYHKSAEDQAVRAVLLQQVFENFCQKNNGQTDKLKIKKIEDLTKTQRKTLEKEVDELMKQSLQNYNAELKNSSSTFVIEKENLGKELKAKIDTANSEEIKKAKTDLKPIQKEINKRTNLHNKYAAKIQQLTRLEQALKTYEPNTDTKEAKQAKQNIGLAVRLSLNLRFTTKAKLITKYENEIKNLRKEAETNKKILDEKIQEAAPLFKIVDNAENAIINAQRAEAEHIINFKWQQAIKKLNLDKESFNIKLDLYIGLERNKREAYRQQYNSELTGNTKGAFLGTLGTLGATILFLLPKVTGAAATIGSVVLLVIGKLKVSVAGLASAASVSSVVYPTVEAVGAGIAGGVNFKKPIAKESLPEQEQWLASIEQPQQETYLDRLYKFDINQDQINVALHHASLFNFDAYTKKNRLLHILIERADTQETAKKILKKAIKSKITSLEKSLKTTSTEELKNSEITIKIMELKSLGSLILNPASGNLKNSAIGPIETRIRSLKKSDMHKSFWREKSGTYTIFEAAWVWEKRFAPHRNAETPANDTNTPRPQA